MKHTFTLFPILVLGLLPIDLQAIAAIDGSVNSASSWALTAAGHDTTVVAPPAPAMRVLYGRVESPGGALPGAVVRLSGTRQTTVTNAAGEFSLTVPENSGPLAAIVSYAGYADVPVLLSATEQNDAVKLTTPHIIKVSRKQQVKHYVKTARHQLRRSMRRA